MRKGFDGLSNASAMRKVSEEITEVLDYVPGRFEVIRHVRPAYSCRGCEAMAQAQGAHAERVEKPAELADALARARDVVVNERRQALLNVITPY